MFRPVRRRFQSVRPGRTTQRRATHHPLWMNPQANKSKHVENMFTRPKYLVLAKSPNMPPAFFAPVDAEFKRSRPGRATQRRATHQPLWIHPQASKSKHVENMFTRTKYLVLA